MDNKSMQRKIEGGTCRDIAASQRLGPYYVLDAFDADVDYADASCESWVWSIGRADRHLVFEWEGRRYVVPSGTVLASLAADLYQRDGFTCVWLR